MTKGEAKTCLAFFLSDTHVDVDRRLSEFDAVINVYVFGVAWEFIVPSPSEFSCHSLRSS